jgi:hypothetical protein
MKVRGAVVILLSAAAAVAFWPLHAEDLQPPAAANESGAAVNDAGLYTGGTRPINDSRWSDAVGLFDGVAEMHGDHAEAALY